MPCPLCGDICRCSSGEYSAALPRWVPGDDAGSSVAPTYLGMEPDGTEALPAQLSPEARVPSDRNDSGLESSSAWRLEVASRLNRYQARRKPRPPRYPSLRLRFEDDDAIRTGSGASAEPPASPQAMPIVSNQALALDRFAGSAARAVEASAPESVTLSEIQAQERSYPDSRAGEFILHTAAATAAPIAAATTAKIIEFPRSWIPPQAPLDQLAEPVMDRPRILEAPEIVPPPPALGGITIEPAPQQEAEKRLGIDVPLQSAPLALRIFSAAIDGVIIAAACALFGMIFGKVTALRPPRIQIIGLAAGLSAVFWAAYQYLLVVYSGSTPGLRLAGLELAHFDGRPARRRLRRWRVLASFLSAISLGMGYAWVFLDEDSLCWHDRITHTYLAPKRREPAGSQGSSG